MLLAILGILDGGEKNGAYSDGYFVNGTADFTYNTASGTFDLAQDNGLYYIFSLGAPTAVHSTTPLETSGVWYTYNNGARSLANGAYTNGYYDAGAKSTTYDNAIPQPVPDAVEFFTYTDGVSNVANGAYTNGYYTNGTLGDNGTPSEAQDNLGVYYVYANGGVPSLANGAYTNGYYDAGEKSITYDSATPVDTIDGEWYAYVDGVPTAANGAYTNGYYDYGTKNTTYDNATPQPAADSNAAYTYGDGVPSLAQGLYSTGNYYNGIGTGPVNAPIPAQDDGLYYTADSSGVVFVANGAYTNGYFNTGTPSTNHTSSVPVDTIDGDWYTYSNGVPTVASGAYTNGYYTNGILGDNSTPSEAQDNLGVYYVYANGGVPSLAGGAYSNGYFASNGTFDSNYNTASGTFDLAQDNGLYYVYTSGAPTAVHSATPSEIAGVWYTYDNGVRSLASGAYTNGYYHNDGTKSFMYDSATPVDTIDGDWYTYVDGVATAANGGYTNGHYVGGLLSTQGTPYVTSDGASGIYYVYVNQTSSLANGAYSNGYYESGVKSTTYSTSGELIIVNDGGVYSFDLGVPTPAFEYLGYTDCVNQTSNDHIRAFSAYGTLIVSTLVYYNTNTEGDPWTNPITNIQGYSNKAGSFVYNNYVYSVANDSKISSITECGY